MPEAAAPVDAAGDLEETLARSLGPWRARAAAVTRALEAAGRDVAALEASVRGGAGRSIAGARMMIEHLDDGAARAVLSALGVRATCADELLAAAGDAPIIVGWDAARSPALAKAYLNLSDASAARRAAIASALGWSREGVPAAPHVLGVNVAANGATERKLYEQADALDAGDPDALRAWAARLPLAGVVRSWDIDAAGARAPRAAFVSPRHDADVRARLRALPGWDDAAFEAALPFAPGLVRSVGFARDGASWTVYVKPRAQRGELWRLEPAVCLAGEDGCEIGIFVAPTGAAERAHSRSAQHAISYRVRAGAPRREDVEHAMRWALDAVVRAEASGASPALGAPAPEGWRVVAA